MTSNVLIVGVGPHTKMNHLPVIATCQERGLVGSVTGVDLDSTDSGPVFYGTGTRTRVLPVVHVHPFTSSLSDETRRRLDYIVTREQIRAVVVATEPSVHLPYALWALDNGCSVLIDKPLSVHARASVDPSAAKAIANDYDILMRAYDKARRTNPDVIVSVLSQRRFHPAFRKVRDLVSEIADDTNCPVTSIQSFHGDGQWRLPDELLNIGYHGFDRGYGKAAHSGYHFFDVSSWLITASERCGKQIDELEVITQITRPPDTLAQLGVADHENLFDGFSSRNLIDQRELQDRTHNFGEVDVFSTMAYRSKGRTITLGSINLAHQSFSQRSHLDPDLTRLYKGNGRIGQESHIIQQGPFQAIYLQRLQATHPSDSEADLTAVEAKDNLAIQLFRNNRLRSDWEHHVSFGFADLSKDGPEAQFAFTQRSARNGAVVEFMRCLAGEVPRAQIASDLSTHRRSARLMSAVYLSMAQRYVGGSPAATVGFEESPPHGASSFEPTSFEDVR